MRAYNRIRTLMGRIDRATLGRAARWLVCWTLGAPVAFTALLEALLLRVAAPSVARFTHFLATGGVGWLGLRLWRRPVARWRRRFPVRAVGWALCLVGIPLLIWRGWMVALAVGGPLIAAPLIDAMFQGRLDMRWCRGRLRTLIELAVVIAATIGLAKGAYALGEAALGIAIAFALFGPPIAAASRRFARDPRRVGLRLRVATIGVGPTAARLLETPIGRRRVRWPARALAWALCSIETAAFVAYGWLLAPRLAFWALCWPIVLVGLIERLFAKAAGPDWRRAGFRLAIAFVGEWGLRLHRSPPRRFWLRWPARTLAWALCAAGLAWFAMGGAWAVLLIPYLRQGRRLRAAPVERPEDDYARRPLWFRLEPLDYVSLGIIFVVGAMLWVVRIKLHTFAPDGYYHLLAARRIAEDGLVWRADLLDYFREGIIPQWDWWQYAPEGRPHLYPPLFHLLVALCSLPFGKDVEEGMRIVQVLTPPAVFLSTWYLARWLFDARRGFIALLLLGMNLIFVMLAIWALPSILANAIAPLLIVCYLRRRVASSGVLLGVALWAHMGVGPLTGLGLLVFSLIRRDYLRQFVGVALLACLIALPWYGHVWLFREWLGNPMAQQIPEGLAGRALGVFIKMRWLLMLDLLLVLLVVRAWRLIPWAETRYRMLIGMLLGFAPMFIEYGGRFFAHTVQLWVIIAAAPLVRFVSRPVRPGRVALLMGLALIAPTVMLSGMEGGLGLRMHPMVSGWSILSVTIGSGGGFMEAGEHAGQPSYAEAVVLGRRIRQLTRPEQIIHVVGIGAFEAVASLAVTLGYHADRRIDTAAWPEVRPADPNQAETAAADEDGCYVSTDPEALPEGLRRYHVGRYWFAVGDGSRR